MRDATGSRPRPFDREPSRGPATPEASLGKDVPRVLPPRWRSLLLVCGECEDRGKGPKAGTARKIGKEIAVACRAAGLPRPRRIVTDCMGACPKKACTVAGVDARGGTTLLAMKRGDDPEAAVRLLYGAAAAAEPAVPAVALPPLAAPAEASALSNSTSSAPSAT